MKRTNFFLQIFLCISLCLIMLFFTSCQKEDDIVEIPYRSICEVVEDNLYEKPWTWDEENSQYQDITIFHRSTLERILLYQNDTISHYHTSFEWLDNCTEFKKMDSHPQVYYRLKSVNSETMIISRFFEDENKKDLLFFVK